jgi:glutamate dehydrogenase
MGLETDAEKPTVIDTVIENVRRRLSNELDPLVETFVREYYRWVAPADLESRDPGDLAGAALCHWQLAQQRERNAVELRIYNPDPERDRWSSPHTTLEIVTADMPYLVDSVTMELSRLGYDPHLVIHPMIRIARNSEGRIERVVGSDDPDPGRAQRESVMHLELDREDDDARLASLTNAIERVLGDVRCAVRDTHAMRERAIELAIELVTNTDTDPKRGEPSQFLKWLTEGHFTFLGYREYDLTPASATSPATLVAVHDTGLGLLSGSPQTAVTALTEQAAKLAYSRRPLVITKANSRSTVHRPAYLDYVGIKRFSEDGTVLGERRFIGLYTPAAYRESAMEIPLIREKVAAVIERAGFPPDSHDTKVLEEICEAYPRDALFQIRTSELLDTALGILRLGERQQVRVFFRPDPLGRFVDCTVCMPRDRYNRSTRTGTGDVLLGHFGGSHYDWNLQLSEESRVAIIHMLVHTPEGFEGELDPEPVQAKIADAIRAWTQDLSDLINERYEDQRARELIERYIDAFPPAYQEQATPLRAVDVVEKIELIVAEPDRAPWLQLVRADYGDTALRARLLSDSPVSLSAALEIFAHLGAEVHDELPYEIRPAGMDSMWIYDFGIDCADADPDIVGDRFAEIFRAVWSGQLEDDGLGELVLVAGLSAREVVVLRAVSKYLRQAGIPFSDRYVERSLIANPEIARLLVDLFQARHEPTATNTDRAQATEAELASRIDAVTSLDQDRILRAFRSVIDAVVRTNHYQPDADGQPKGYLSFKLDPSRIPLLPHPLPKFEIFVYSPRVEGVHLRGGLVVRGGLRWSDRREDFRTEILGLMKAQMVKNALIVPGGSKGGFVVKQPPSDGGREAFQAEGIACYRTFLCGLLDLTDNISGGEIVPPPNVVRYDGDDPYLVVAADKGTATFSDIANDVSKKYGFWLGDAFASGGSVGYDHKAMGITARGAWESVKRHFRELGTDIQTEDFTVVGIGDMAGDVFGNGMLLSEHTRLVAAFNHRHIFLDPNPDPAASYVERRRLFELPRSAWSDYSSELISPGGGVFDRSLKQIELTPEVQQRLGIEADVLTPAELISAILKAPVDLLWNGGIGTYVKARAETDQEVGDRANDAVRVNGSDLRVRVVGEGGNLGFTQRGRIEYASDGGRIYTDAIDNVAGVNTSDHEVNIKILLDSAINQNTLKVSERNELLADMTDAVGERVLTGSYLQTQAMSLAVLQAPSLVNAHARMIRSFESSAGLERAIEFLPSNSEIADRQSKGRGLLSPELAVMMAYSKVYLDNQLLDSSLPEDEYMAECLSRYFPAPLPERFPAELQAHRLRREIIATVVANELVDRQGITFVYRVTETTGAAPDLVARAYAVARDVFRMQSFWESVEALDNKVDASIQLSMLAEGRRLVERGTRRVVRSNQERVMIRPLVERYQAAAEVLWREGSERLAPEDQSNFEQRVEELTAGGVSEELARRVAAMATMVSVFDIVELSLGSGRDLPLVIETGRGTATSLHLAWVSQKIVALPRADRWQTLARDALRDDLATLQRELNLEILAGSAEQADAEAETLIERWSERKRSALDRYLQVLADIRDSGNYDTTTLPVLLRELRGLVG